MLGILGALFTIALSFLFETLFIAWEQKTLDARFILRGPLATHPDIIMIDADDASSKIYGRWPWKRTVYTEMVRFLQREKPKVVAYDILFAHPGNEEEDRSLIEAVGQSDNILFPVATELSYEDKTSSALVPISGLISAPVDSDFLSVTRSILPLPELKEKVAGLGHIAANRDSDGVIRRVPLLLNYQGKLLPSLSFQAVLNFLEVSPDSLKFQDDTLILPRAVFPGSAKPVDISVPIDRHGQMLINFVGTWTKTFKHASFASVLEAKPGQSQGEDLTGKLILVSNALSGLDFTIIPFEKNYPGGGIHANIINTILTRDFLREVSETGALFLTLVISLGTAALFRIRSYLGKIASVIGLLVLYGLSSVALFHLGLVIPVVVPLLSILFTAIGVSTYQAYVEKKHADHLSREKKYMEKRLAEVLEGLTLKMNEVESIQQSLDVIKSNFKEQEELSQTNARKIADFEQKLSAAIQQSEHLKTERESLERKVLDLEIHVFEDVTLEENDWERLRQECERVGIITRAQNVLEIFQMLKQYAKVPSAVLILGVSGTGKELFARAIHLLSDRKNQKFVAVNMAAIPHDLVESELFGHVKGSFTGALSNKKGKFMEADQGSIFLDEIGEMSRNIQVKLLRVLQEKEVQPVGGQPCSINVRIISATNKNLKDEVARGAFREDLFFRLNTLPLNLPPLRERGEDIEFLVQHFVDKYSREYGKPIEGVSESAMSVLKNYYWPGNVRELENVIQRGIALAKTELIQTSDLGITPGPASSIEEGTSPAQKPATDLDELMLDALRENGFEVNATARKLNMSRNTVASRFKGICFKRLVVHQLDADKVAKNMTHDTVQRKLVMQKLKEYHKNLVKNAGRFDQEEKAVADAIQKAKNVPSEYHFAIEQLVRKCFEIK